MSANTKHGPECSMSFGRPSPVGCCARCDELRAGAAPRDGWQKAHFERKRREEEHARNAPKHDCKKSGCLPICTFGDW